MGQPLTGHSSALRATEPVRRLWPAGLTDREVEVLRETAQGARSSRSPPTCTLAPKTVDFHLQNIDAKTQVNTRAGVTLFAIRTACSNPEMASRRPRTPG